MTTRGEVYWVNWSPARGSEQAGQRPALVVQNNTGNQLSPTTIVAAITSRPMQRRYPFHVPLPGGTLPKESTIMCEQLITIDQSRLVGNRVALLSDKVMEEVDEALKRSLGLR